MELEGRRPAGEPTSIEQLPDKVGGLKQADKELTCIGGLVVLYIWGG